METDVFSLINGLLAGFEADKHEKNTISTVSEIRSWASRLHTEAILALRPLHNEAVVYDSVASLPLILMK